MFHPQRNKEAWGIIKTPQKAGLVGRVSFSASSSFCLRATPRPTPSGERMTDLGHSELPHFPAQTCAQIEREVWVGLVTLGPRSPADLQAL